MKSVLLHAGLLIFALLAAFITWTAGDGVDNSGAPIEVWDHEPDDVVDIVYREDGRSVRLERRSTGGESHLWGSESLADSATAPEEFPAGEAGTAVVADFAALRALRDLGDADPARRTDYGLAAPRATVTIRFRDGTERTLAIGSSVVGDGHRYALDTTGQRIYVLPAGLIRPLEAGGGALRLSQLQSFDPDDVATASISANGFQRTMQRRLTGVPPHASWLHPGTDRLDQTFTNFMDQLDSFWVLRYEPDIATDTLQTLMRAAYLGARGDTLGTLALFRTRSADPAPRYFVRTRRTIVLGEVHASIAERVERDLETLSSAAGGRD